MITTNIRITSSFREIVYSFIKGKLSDGFKRIFNNILFLYGWFAVTCEDIIKGFRNRKPAHIPEDNRKAAEKKTIISVLTIHVRRALVVLFNTICGNMIFYLLVGAFNRLSGRPIKSIFLFYSVNIEYQRTMIPDWYAKVVRWRPGLGQVIRQDGNWCLSFGITSSDNDFRNESNFGKLKKLYSNVDCIRKIIGADQMTFSGILPGLFIAKRIMKGESSYENRNTVRVVLKAVEEIVILENLPHDCPVIVLGGRGFIGEKIIEILEADKREAYSVDLKDKTPIPSHLRGKPVIVLNTTKTGALTEYIPRFWKEAVIINEVYPEPSAIECELMNKKGIRCYHISGVKAYALPRFMKAYKGGIPCCAAYLPDNNFQTIVTRLV